MGTRSVNLIESRILEILGKVRNGKYPIYLSLSAMVLTFEVQSIQEQKNFDLALSNLLKKGLIKEEEDGKGYKVYKMAA